MVVRKKSGWGGQREGAGRKPVLRDPVMLTLRVDGEVFDQLGELADEAGVSRSDYVRRILTRHTSRRRGATPPPEGRHG